MRFTFASSAFALRFIFILLCSCSCHLSFILVDGYVYTPLNNATCLATYNVNWVGGSSGGSVLPIGMQWPVCMNAYTYVPSYPTYSYMYGGMDDVNVVVNNTLFTSTDGFQSLSTTPRLDTTVGPRRYSKGCVTGNGTLIITSGERTTSSSSARGDVYVSYDHGATFNTATTTAAFSGLYNHAIVCIPGTSIVIIVGGDATGTSTEQANVWINSDYGVTWTEVSTASTSPKVHSAGGTSLVALYDSVNIDPVKYSSPYSTLIFFLEYSYGDYFFSYDHGYSWTQAW